jgi:hypothetical protein
VDIETEAVNPAVDFALLADAVQALSGKLYVLGGGWDILTLSSFPARHPSLAIGIRVRVPWSRADEEIRIGVDLQDEDGRRVLPGPELVHEIKVRRPEGLPQGSDIGLVRSFTFNNLLFESPGAFSFVISINGEVSARLRFSVRKHP